MLEFEGQLYGAQSGWLLLRVPNALAIGAFRALNEPGLVLPSHGKLPFNAHISVMTKEEVDSIGGLDKINERGKSFGYSLIGADSVQATDRDGAYSRYWYLQVRSASLAALRRTYGLPEPQVPFHVTIAARPRMVLRQNGISKLSELVNKKPSYADDWQHKVRQYFELVPAGN